jgi:hypothetical protein
MADEFVMVPVPAGRVQEVYALLAKPPGHTGAGVQAEEPSSETGWNAGLVRRMFKESGDPMQQMLRLLADADGAEISTNEIAEQLGLPKGAMSVAGMAGALGRRVSSRYSMDGPPWTTRWRFIDPSDQSKGTETLIAMPTWVCEVIRNL